jgi:alkylation response protein AidB-like acyl-CoA dehydrogenase
MFEWSETDLMTRDAVRGFIDKEIRPNIDALESGEMLPYPVLRKLFTSFGLDAMATEALEKQLDRERLREEALARGEQPPARRKREGSSADSGQESAMMLAIAELAGVSLGLVAAAAVSLGLGVATIRSRGTLAQKQRWLPELVTLEKVAAWAITEPDAGSDAFGGMRTQVTRDGRDYLLNGQKTFITNGPYADVTVVYAKLAEDGVPPRDRKVLAFVLDSGLAGFTQGRPFRKMGMHSSPTGELFFDNVRLGRDRLLGETEDHEHGDGRDSARGGFTAERVGVAALAFGIISECLRLCVDYAGTRSLWGKKIGQFQLIQAKLAEMEIARINVQNMLFQAIERNRHGKPLSLPEASAIKLYSSRAAADVANEAVQLFGGNGYMTEFRVEQLARDAKSLMIYAGSNEIQTIHVARGLLGEETVHLAG